MDEEGWFVGGTSIYANLFCSDFSEGPHDWCAAIMKEENTANLGKSIQEACCFCGGSTFKTTPPSLQPTSSPTLSFIPTIEPMPSSQPSDCENEPNWYFSSSDDHILDCDNIIINDTEDMCDRFKDIDYNGKTVLEACCICKGGTHKSRQPSDIPSLSQIPSLTPSASQQPSTKPSTFPSSMPSQSLLPSTFPTVTNGTVLDMQLCRHHGECRSEVCEEISLTESTCAPGVSFTPHPPFHTRFDPTAALTLRFTPRLLKDKLVQLTMRFLLIQGFIQPMEHFI